MLRKIAWLCCFVTLLIPTAAWAKGVPIDTATEEQKEAAKTPYVDGRTAFDEGRYDEALRHFTASYDVVASPNSHHMMAMAMRELGQLAQAYEHFGEVAAEADAAAVTDEKYKKAADNARAKRDEVMKQIGFINIEVVNPDGARSLSIGGRPIERARWTGPIPANPGNNEVVLTLNSGETMNKSVQVTAGGSHDLRISAAKETPVDEPPPETDNGTGIQWFTPYRITSYAVGGAGLLSFAIAAGLGSAAQSKHDELGTTCNPAPCPQLEDDISSGESLQVATNVMVVVGVVLVAGGAALWVFAPDANGFGGAGGEEDGGDDGSDFSLYVAPTPAGVMLGGQF